MPIQLASFGVGLAAFGLYCALFLVLVRTRLGTGWFALQLAVALFAHILTAWLAFKYLNGFLYWYALGLFAVCWFAFFTLSTAIYVSVSARILRTMAQSPSASLSMDEIYEACIREPFRERAGFLVASGLVNTSNTGYRLTERGVSSAQRLRSLRAFLGMEGAGLYPTTKDEAALKMRPPER